MNQLISAALQSASIGQLAHALSQKLERNVEVKVKPDWVRVQHTSHHDRLMSPESIDKALMCNSLQRNICTL